MSAFLKKEYILEEYKLTLKTTVFSSLYSLIKELIFLSRKFALELIKNLRKNESGFDFCSGNNFYFGMSEERKQESIIRTITDDPDFASEVSEIKEDIRRSRTALMRHLEEIPEEQRSKNGIEA